MRCVQKHIHFKSKKRPIYLTEKKLENEFDEGKRRQPATRTKKELKLVKKKVQQANKNEERQ